MNRARLCRQNRVYGTVEKIDNGNPFLQVCWIRDTDGLSAQFGSSQNRLQVHDQALPDSSTWSL